MTIKKKNPIEFECTLELSGCTVLFQVLKQSPELTYNGRNYSRRFEGSKMAIQSMSYPSIDSDRSTIYIRGNEPEKDENYSVQKFDNRQRAETYYQRAILTLEEWRQAGFKMEDD